eukprot:scaffold5529_cov117-Cylindrotheca_fusiformis.AAC.5
MHFTNPRAPVGHSMDSAARWIGQTTLSWLRAKRGNAAKMQKRRMKLSLRIYGENTYDPEQYVKHWTKKTRKSSRQSCRSVQSFRQALGLLIPQNVVDYPESAYAIL